MLSVGCVPRSVAPSSAQLGVPDTGTGEGTLAPLACWKHVGFQLGKVLWAALHPRDSAADAGCPHLYPGGLRVLERTEDDWELGAGALLTVSVGHAQSLTAVAKVQNVGAQRVVVVENVGATVVAAGQQKRAVEREVAEDEGATTVDTRQLPVDEVAARSARAGASWLVADLAGKREVAGAVVSPVPVAEEAAQGAVVAADFVAQTVGAGVDARQASVVEVAAQGAVVVAGFDAQMVVGSWLLRWFHYSRLEEAQRLLWIGFATATPVALAGADVVRSLGAVVEARSPLADAA